MINEDRELIWNSFSGEKLYWLERTMCLYNRYHEANLIIDELKFNNVNLKSIKVLDFGCACGDYGMALAREGAVVAFHDIIETAMDLAVYRATLENLNCFAVKNYHFDEYNFVIFGEVLEHLDNSLELLESCLNNNVKWIFTSSYPYRSDDPEDKYWKKGGHMPAARLSQKPCRELLEKNYSFVKFDGQLRLWTKLL